MGFVDIYKFEERSGNGASMISYRLNDQVAVW